MKVLIRCGNVYHEGTFKPYDLSIENGIVSGISAFKTVEPSLFDVFYDFTNFNMFPGFADVHVHLREPGFSYKETIRTGTAAAARGGFTAVCTMPNLDPAQDSAENLSVQLEIIKKDALVNVYPYASITKGRAGNELVDFEKLSVYTKLFSDDGSGVQTGNIMESAMKEANRYGGIIAAHCEDESLLCGGYIHDGIYARDNSHKGISSKSEWIQVKRDADLAKRTGCAYHVCHVSTKESVEIIRKAKAEGIDISCETAPHYLVFTDKDLEENGCFKMNPPIRSPEDREALIAGINDGTIDCIATDHAPHSKDEKSKGLKDSAMGVVGLETAFSAVYTHLVKTKKISLEKLTELMSANPRKRFSLGGGRIAQGEKADFNIIDLNAEYTVDPEKFLSMGRSTPFEGMKLFGEIIMTYTDGRIVWQQDTIKK